MVKNEENEKEINFREDKCNKKSTKKAKGSNYFPLHSEEGTDKLCVRLPGRHPCLCEASVHELVGNCLNCGRIVCSQEQFPCFTCGKERLENSSTQQNSKKFSSTPNVRKNESFSGLKDIAASFEKAVDLKNKLLESDNNPKLTKVIDDENDYFRLSSEHWLSDEQRKEIDEQIGALHEKKRAKSRKLLIDFAGKQITAVKVPEIADFESAVKEVEKKTVLQSDYEVVDSKDIEISQEITPPEYCYKPNKTKQRKSVKYGEWLANSENPLERLKVQDSNLMEMSDEGICLSIRQPWASLLMHSIKLHEGRNWFTPYRGRVWIHSSAKEVKDEEIAKAENMFRLMGVDNDFPNSYPTGVLLGFAYLVNCVAQEDYKLKYPNGYVDDLYSFIFEDPTHLKVKIPMKGGGKLFKLNEQVFKAAKSQVKF